MNNGADFRGSGPEEAFLHGEGFFCLLEEWFANWAMD